MAGRISYSQGFTRNMGDFNSSRTDIGMEADFTDNPGEVFDKAKKFVDTRLQAEWDELDEDLAK